MDAGVFHDAHEVYFRLAGSDQWTWVATFATKNQADHWALMQQISGSSADYEVRAV